MSAHDTITFAALGDVHGRMRAAARILEQWERHSGRALDFALQVGDFEPHRDEEDLRTMDAPSKYKDLGDFPLFHRGRERFPCPLYFIGGNHEPHGWLEQHPEGFELVEGCHYLGRAGVSELRGLRVAFLSGIHGEEHFERARPDVARIHELPNREWIYFNEADVERVLAAERADVLLIHEWPEGVMAARDRERLGAIARRKGLRPGNPWARLLMEALRPRLVLCGHMHLRYSHDLELPDGSRCAFAALGHMRDHHEALAVFEWCEGELERLM